ncbi:MAG: cyclic lactone autoinducer peptide [Oscillospiraceae bacterium]|nr:cyclic lactone autoinducer peptide [Oscillospiraceae bacterium]
MKKQNTKHILSSITAKLTRHVAVKGAGLASLFGIYQPKVPKKLER